MKKVVYPAVYIEWLDAEHDGGWSDVRDEVGHQLTTIKSIGWIIESNKQCIVVASSYNPPNQFGNKQYIPKKMITKLVKRKWK